MIQKQKKKPRLIQPKRSNEVKRRNQLMIPTDINVVSILQELHDCKNMLNQKDAIIKEQKLNLLRKTSKLVAQRKKEEAKILQLKQSDVYQIDIMPKKTYKLSLSGIDHWDLPPDPEQYQICHDYPANFDEESAISGLQQLGENLKFNNGYLFIYFGLH